MTDALGLEAAAGETLWVLLMQLDLVLVRYEAQRLDLSPDTLKTNGHWEVLQYNPTKIPRLNSTFSFFSFLSFFLFSSNSTCSVPDNLRLANTCTLIGEIVMSQSPSLPWEYWPTPEILRCG